MRITATVSFPILINNLQSIHSVDELFRFLNSWVPHLYGELNEEKVTERGYELIQHDTEWAQGGVSKEGRMNSDGEDIAELTRESWELLKAPYVKIFNIIKSQTGSNDLEGVEVRTQNLVESKTE
uniref:Uncharacterized protein n=1 Tax=Phlebotomus papatasi TaxID=29031 RepID=A0A1B0D4D6_PHLPP